MRAGRIFLVLALIAGALATASAPAAAPLRDDGDGRSTLAGTTVISGRRAGVVEVRVATPAVWTGDTSEVKIRGGGELPGFVLTKTRKETYEHPVLGPIETEYEDMVVSGVRLPAKGAAKKLSAEERTLLLMPMKTAIEPGDYKLYLLADGAPVKVRLELKGLFGSTRITPGSPTGLDMKTLPERTQASAPVAGLFTAGDDSKLERMGLVFDALVVEMRDSPEGEFGSCVYRGKPVDEEQGDVVSYGPHCVGAMDRDRIQSSFHYFSTFPGGRYGISYGMVYPLERDDWTISNWYRGTGTIGRASAYGYWLNFR